MPHVLVAGWIHPCGLDVLRAAAGFTFEMVEAISAESYAPKMPQAEALLIRTQPLSAAMVARAPRLRIVSRHGVGFDAVDVAALEARNIPLTVVGDVNSRSVAEHAFALILALAKRLPAHDAATRGSGWTVRNSLLARELSGKRLLLVGYGRIGRTVGDMARAFGVTVTVHDPFQSAASVAETGAWWVADLAEGLREADIVSLHLPKAGDRPVIGAGELDLMRPGALLVNTARGGLIDEIALADALEAGRIAGAGLDVFDREPPSRDNRLLRSAKVILTPHVAGLTEESAARMSAVAARNIVDFFEGRLDPSLVVNRVAS